MKLVKKLAFLAVSVLAFGASSASADKLDVVLY